MANCRFFTPASPALNSTVSVCAAPSPSRTMSRSVRIFPESRTTQPCFLAFQSPLMERDLGLEARFCERARRQLDVGDFDIVRHALAAEADGVNGDALPLDVGDGVEIDAAAVVSAIAHQNHGADGQRCRIGQHLLQPLADVRGGQGGGQLVGAFNAFQMIAQPIKSHLKFALQALEETAVERREHLVFARVAVLFGRHAFAVVNHHRDDVLLRPKRGDTQRGLPQQEKKQADQQALQDPDHGAARTAHGGRNGAAAAPDHPAEAGRGDEQQQRERPHWPLTEKHETAFGEDSGRILKKKLKHRIGALRTAGAVEPQTAGNTLARRHDGAPDWPRTLHDRAWRFPALSAYHAT